MVVSDGLLTRGALLVGSVPLASTEAVLRATSASLGAHLRRVPDGETGERTYWMVFQLPRLARNLAFSAPLAGAVSPFLRAYARHPLVRANSGVPSMRSRSRLCAPANRQARRSVSARNPDA